MVVIGIIVIMTLLLVPAFTSRKSSDEVTGAMSDVIDALQNARTFAVANNTYVWVGFFEENPGAVPTNPRSSGIGRIVILVASSREGNRYKDTDVDTTEPHAFYPPSASPTPIPASDKNPVLLSQVGKLTKIENSHLAVLPQTDLPRPAVAAEYQIGADEFTLHPPTLGASPVPNPTTFNYPLSAAAPDVEYTFTKIIEFNPRGEALKIVDLPTQLVEIGLQPTHGNTVDGNSRNIVAIQVSGATGKTKVYRP